MPKEKEGGNRHNISLAALLIIATMFILLYGLAVLKTIAVLDAGVRLTEFCTNHPDGTWYGSLGLFDVKPVPCDDEAVQDLVKKYPDVKYACEQVRNGNVTVTATDVFSADTASALIFCLR